MVCCGVDRAHAVDSCRKTSGDVGAKDVVAVGGIIKTLEERELVGIEWLSFLER